MSSIRVMRTFLAVAAEGSFTAAAQRVALTQAAVGLQMRTLESDLRRTLFERRGKAVLLSAAGRELLPAMRHLVETYERIAEAPDPLRSMSGTVHLGIISSALQPLVRCMLELRRVHPALDLRVSMARPLDLIKRVELGELDAAITTRYAMPGDTEIAWTTLYTEPMVMIANSRLGDASVRELLRDQPYIGFDAREPTGQLIQRALKRLRARPLRLLEISATDAIVDLVRAGLGVAVVPHLAGSDWHRDPRLRIAALPVAAEPRQIALVQRKNDDKAALIGAVANEFLRHMRSEIDRPARGL
jgi:DNA-binding transcriptional LysR family regulator